MSKHVTGLVVSCVVIGVVLPDSAHGQGIIFEEIMGPSLHLVTDPVQTPPSPDPFPVWKFVENASGVRWLDFHIDLEVPDPAGGWQKSGQGDGVSFDEPTPFAAWSALVEVDINGVFQGPAGGTWEVQRMNEPFDQLWFDFTGFAISPGDVLSLHFPMRDFTGNEWRLAQEATIPAPGGLAIVTLGGLIATRRRR